MLQALARCVSREGRQPPATLTLCCPPRSGGHIPQREIPAAHRASAESRRPTPALGLYEPGHRGCESRGTADGPGPNPAPKLGNATALLAPNGLAKGRAFFFSAPAKPKNRWAVSGWGLGLPLCRMGLFVFAAAAVICSELRNTAEKDGPKSSPNPKSPLQPPCPPAPCVLGALSPLDAQSASGAAVCEHPSHGAALHRVREQPYTVPKGSKGVEEHLQPPFAPSCPLLSAGMAPFCSVGPNTERHRCL